MSIFETMRKIAWQSTLERNLRETLFTDAVISPELIRKARAGGLAEAEWENGGRVLSCQDRIFVGAVVGEPPL